MAVAPTGAIYKSLYFDGEDSRNYGVYITGQAVYNAPEREVEMIAIPGRNGALALDKGRFENIEVTYPAGIYADTEADFAEAISNFRNLLCSRRGYVRLQDEYNPNEYRMAIYKSGLEVEPTMLKAGEFEIVFDCKPQRWLTDGESAISVDSGDVVSNPTLFESSPLLEVEGYGTVGFNGYEIELDNAVMGDVTVAESGSVIGTSVPLNTALYNDGDTITVGGTTVNVEVRPYASGQRINAITSASASGDGSYEYYLHGTVRAGITITLPSFSLSSTSTNSVTETVTLVLDMILSGNTHQSVTFSTTVTITYDDDAVTGVWTKNTSVQRVISSTATSTFSGATADSTVNILGHPTYIDCDLGEAYKAENDEIISLNRYIELGSDLPKLAVGNNTFTFDNTVTDLKVVPRYWKI